MADEGNDVSPDWVDAKFIEQALKTYYKDDNLSISKFSIKCANSKGDNFSSIMSRASFEVTTKGKTFIKKIIIKTMPTHATAVAYVDDTESFQTEILMLTKVIPDIEDILKEIGHTEPLAPEVIYSALEPEKVIVMEDLCDTNFSVADRLQGLSLEQCLLVMRSLATFHAGSVAALQKQPELAKLCKSGFWSSENKANNLIFLRDGFEVLKENVDDWSGQKWSDKLEKLGNVPEKMYNVYDDTSKDKAVVITHGDIWTNNIMFRNGGSSINDVRFVDFQLSTCRSPVYDLLYFIFSSPKRDVRFQHMDTIIKAYHDQWALLEKKLQLPVHYSFDDLLNEIKEKAIFAFCMFYGVLAVVFAPKDDAVDVLTESDSMKDSGMYRNKHYQECIVDGLPYFSQIGLI